MATAAPPVLSELASRLLQRPPSIQDLAVRLGYADDYAWFVELVHRLFPGEAKALLSLPDMSGRLERFAELFREHHFPLYPPFLEFYEDEETGPPFTWLRQGIPFQLMGISYDDLHEMWTGYRAGLSALVLLAEDPSDHRWGGPDAIRTAWLEAAALYIPQETLQRVPLEGIPLEALNQAVRETFYEGAAHAAAWVRGETGNFFLDYSNEEGDYEGFADSWEDEVIAEGTQEWQRASALTDSVISLAEWLEEDLRVRFAGLLDFILPRLPEPLRQDPEQENDHDGC